MKIHILNQTDNTRTVVRPHGNGFIISFEKKVKCLWFKVWRVESYFYSLDLKELNL